MEKNIRIINLTPHTVRIPSLEYGEVIIHPSGTVARVACTRAGVMAIWDQKIQVSMVDPGSIVEGLPKPEDHVRYIVCALASQTACRSGRHDTLVPSDLVRDEHGSVIAALSLRICCEKAHVEYQSVGQ